MTHLDRVLTMLGLLLVFTLDEVHLSHERPRAMDLAHGYVHQTAVRVVGSFYDVYLSTPDLALRWGLALLVASAGCWVVAHTLKPEKSSRQSSGRGPFGI